MDEMKFFDVIKEGKIILESPDLVKYQNQEVEIRVIPVTERREKIKTFFDTYGKLDNSTAEEMKKIINESKTISDINPI